MSTMRIMKASTRPPRKPAVAPQAMPRVTDESVARMPTINEMRPPIRQRTSRSRPESSVPNQWKFWVVGGRRMASQSVVSKA